MPGTPESECPTTVSTGMVGNAPAMVIADAPGPVLQRRDTQRSPAIDNYALAAQDLKQCVRGILQIEITIVGEKQSLMLSFYIMMAPQ